MKKQWHLFHGISVTCAGIEKLDEKYVPSHVKKGKAVPVMGRGSP
jgi:hypothetical protein